MHQQIFLAPLIYHLLKLVILEVRRFRFKSIIINNYRPYGELTFTLVDGDEYTANTTESLRIVKVIIEDAETSSYSITLSFTVPERVLEGQDIEVLVSNDLETLEFW